MDTKQLNDALARLFIDEGERVVFWHDPAHEFIDFMNRGSPGIPVVDHKRL
jgi:hypothetical protein